MTERGRKLGIRERSCGLQSPPEEFQPHNHSGFKIISASSYGNTASNWSVSQQSQPKISEISVVNAEWNT